MDDGIGCCSSMILGGSLFPAVDISLSAEMMMKKSDPRNNFGIVNEGGN